MTLRAGAGELPRCRLSRHAVFVGDLARFPFKRAPPDGTLAPIGQGFCGGTGSDRARSLFRQYHWSRPVVGFVGCKRGWLEMGAKNG
jgi:hypothetical protein